MESRSKRFTFCLCFAFSFFSGYFLFSRALYRINIYENLDSVLVRAKGYINQHYAAIINQEQDKNNHITDEFLKRKEIKQCFHLSINDQPLEGLVKIKMIDSYSGKGTSQSSENVTAKRVRKIHSKMDSMLCTRFVTIKYAASEEGRIGNQMFRIASLIGLAYMYDVIPVIPSRLPLNKYFDLPNRINNTEVSKISNALNCIAKKSAVFYNCSKVFSVQSNISIQGYLQSWKYFVNATDLIREIFKFKSKYLINANRFLSNVSIDGYQRVCIHVRRTDFTNKHMLNEGFVIPGLDFIDKAKTFFIRKYSNVQFLVVSDDKSWCKKNLNGVIISSLTDPGDEMALMKLSDHVIVTAGTYGWWGAWLSGGTTVYFDKYMRPGSRLASRMNKDDYFPPTWIGMS